MHYSMPRQLDLLISPSASTSLYAQTVLKLIRHHFFAYRSVLLGTHHKPLDAKWSKSHLAIGLVCVFLFPPPGPCSAISLGTTTNVSNMSLLNSLSRRDRNMNRTNSHKIPASLVIIFHPTPGLGGKAGSNSASLSTTSLRHV